MLRSSATGAIAATALRLLLLFLSGLALVAVGRPLVDALLTLGAAYLVAACVLGGLAWRWGNTWVAAAGALLDTGLVTALIWQLPDTRLPLWGLYVLVLAMALIAGWRPASVAVVAILLAMVGTGWERGDVLVPSSLWTLGMVAAILGSLTLAAKVLEARQRQAVWHVLAEQARAEAQQALRCEQILRQTVVIVATAPDAATAQQRIVQAAQEGTGAVVALAARPGGDLLAGEASLLEGQPRARAVNGQASPTGAVTALPFGHGRSLLVRRAAPPLDAQAIAWLEELGVVAAPLLERVEAHEALRNREAALSQVVEQLPAPVAVWDPSGDLLVSNAAYRTLRLPESPPHAGVDSQEEEVRIGEPPQTFVVATLPLASGHVLRLYRDVTREREALRAKDQLISLVGHELRTPLTSIYGYSQMMARQLGVVQQQVGHLNALIRDFMDAARLDSGELPLLRQLVDVAALAQAAAERFQGAFEGRTLELAIAADLPPVEADPTRLGQVLDNLLSNAAKYSPADSPIILTLQPSNGGLLLSVADRGAGLAPEHVPHVFERFYRVPQSREQAEGSGLGLAIVRDLVAAHGGRIWVESPGEGQGSTFFVALPAAAPRPDHEETVEVQAATPTLPVTHA